MINVPNQYLITFLDVRLKKFTEEKQELQNEVQKLQQQLNDIKTRGRRSSSVNGVIDDDDYEDAQRELLIMAPKFSYPKNFINF